MRKSLKVASCKVDEDGCFGIVEFCDGTAVYWGEDDYVVPVRDGIAYYDESDSYVALIDRIDAEPSRWSGCSGEEEQPMSEEEIEQWSKYYKGI